jgi:PAS domain S-box-containing protein
VAWRGAVVVLGLLIAGGLSLVDAMSGAKSIVIATVVLAPFVVSALAGPRETALVAAVAVTLAVVSGAWNHNFDAGAYYLRCVVVIAGGAVSVLASGARERTSRDRARFALLAALADVADGRLTLEETAARLGGILVPAFADICILDVVHERGLRRLATKAYGPAAAELEARLMQRRPTSPQHPGSGSVASSGWPQLLTTVSDEVLRAVAHDEDDLALLRSLHMTAAVVVPLSARGRILGVVTLLLTDQSHRRYVPEDVRFVEVLAGRVALALDNAGLFTDLQTIEAQLTTALGSLGEAVTVQNAQGNLIYANQAAAEMMGFGAPHEVLAEPADALVGRYEFFHDDGSPLDPAEFPGRRVLTGADPEPLIMRVVDQGTGEQRWRMTKSSAVRDRQGHLTMVVNVIADITAVKRAELAQRLLAQASDVLNSSLELQETLQQVADLCVPDLADWCTVRLPDEQRRLLQSVAVSHADPAKVALAWSTRERYPVSLDDPGGIAQVFREAKPLWVNGITDEMLVAGATDASHLDVMRRLAPRAVLLLPMTARAGPVGVLTLVSAESGRTFGEDDIALATELARRAAAAVENARLYTERSRIARTLQDSLLPPDLPARRGWRTATLYRPAGDEDRVGGDFYEGFALDDDAWMLVVGDVTGRGAAAAALTAQMRHTLRAIATFTGSALHALDKLNRDLAAREQTSLCTAVCVVLRGLDSESQADIICAGHPLPLLLRDGAAEYVGQFGPMLGAFADESWDPLTVTLRPGDILVLYSDGVLDAAGGEDRFGPERLQQALACATSATDAVTRIERALADFEVGAQVDDTAVLAVERIDVPDTGHSDAERSRSTSS